MRAARSASLYWAAFSVTGVVSGCGLVFDLSPEDPSIDGGRGDAGRADAGLTDGGQVDAGGHDAGREVDAGADGGPPDAGGDAGARPCRSSLECADGLYCERGGRRCYGEGICAPRPPTCPDFFDPQCGCDFVLYDNACEAARAGVNVLREVACPLMAAGGEWCEREATGSDPGGCLLCFDDTDCTGSLIEHCVAASCDAGVPGVCSFAVAAGRCFDQRQCRSDERCVGAVIDICPPQDGSCEAL